MGSGETSPTMVTTHRSLFSRVGGGGSTVRGGGSGSAVLLDTPFAFQENRADIAGRAVEYFRESVGRDVSVVSLDGDEMEAESALAALRAAAWVFAGPGSPSYALRQWRPSMVPAVLQEKLVGGGCVVFASAAALTLGVVSVPVYEIYKVGEEPAWLEGLDLLSAAGMRAAVIPHFNNAEGGNHDTRYCYLGERRLRMLEESLPADAFVLGVDEHTGLVMDLDAGSASVVGLGVVTVRGDGSSTEFPSGSVVGLEELRPGGGGSGGGGGGGSSAAVGSTAAAQPAGEPARSPLLTSVARLSLEFDAALAGGDGAGAVRAALELESELVAWSRDTLQSDEGDQARSVLRSMIVRLGQAADVGPFVDALLGQRAAARAAGRYDDADAVRDVLVGLGVEVNDGPQGSTWRLLS
jgi:cyanophycinase-like exopeptidase